MAQQIEKLTALLASTQTLAPSPPAPPLIPVASPPMGAPPMRTKINAPWSKWDGAPQTFPMFFIQLKVRARMDHEAGQKDDSISLNLLYSLPHVRQVAVQHKFSKGEERGYGWKDFIEYIRGRFMDQEA
ncbi:hypothetical protein Cpir12675_002791 [Ceratocystis pirilliformis]|uniref:Uncharacterized protein n=1 Tax=Ceratocystis pirilliformis TaxID=259994 RepID=A0ABR3Z762_9PEZI